MPLKKAARSATSRSKALQLPMPRKDASALVLRTRVFLERLRAGEIDRSLVTHLAQVTLITGFITNAGYGRLPIDEVNVVENRLGKLLAEFETSGTWACPDDFELNAITAVVNEYDRMLGTIRLEIFARASDYLDKLMSAAVTKEAGATGT